VVVARRVHDRAMDGASNRQTVRNVVLSLPRLVFPVIGLLLMLAAQNGQLLPLLRLHIQ
jgi:hypothetical protein